MATAQKIVLSSSRDIPFNKLVLSQSNVRRIKAGVSIEELAESIARRTLLQSLTVRPVLDADGAETGMFEVPAGGRRYRALQLLVKQKRLPKTAPIPCVVRETGLAEEDSLAENIERAPLHPLDQFRAFQAMREKGHSEEEIAAAFFVSANVVQQRLRLAAVSPILLDIYAEDGMTLEQLMAFTVNPDHERQEQVWEALQCSYSRQPFEIRRMLTESAVRASDRRAQFVGIDAYVEAGGSVMRDLFESDAWPDPIPLVTFPPGGLYRDAMFERIERERRRWYIAFSGSSLHNVLVAVEAGLGLSLLPVEAALRHRVRRHAPFGMEPAMVVSLYAWEKTGPASELVERMAAALAVDRPPLQASR
jgi:ParB family chromosome partitioning protein